ncbi:hypothetical protein KC19_3G078200 [Ceratodon purpureus]|uniref:Uncharacterized protein n=1 Tax=Ceratodon purpureus TaxID=3225 RepID=A0A8T0IG42_CERPU|nr:hypothetical protein KC19_3G078200 [Ceratodon purpureus]
MAQELWLRDESDDPKSRTYCLDYHKGCMEQPPLAMLVARVNRMHSSLDTEVSELQTHARKALKAEEERDWESAFQEYNKFLKVLPGFDEYSGTRSFPNYGCYLWVEAWAGIPMALYSQTKLGKYGIARSVFATLRASRDDEINGRLPMTAYASIDQHLRIIDWETSYMLIGRGQEGLGQVLADSAVRDFRPRWFLHDEFHAEATLCHLLGNQHRKFGQYETAAKWRSELRKWVELNRLSLDAQVEIVLGDVYLLCDMDDYLKASQALLMIKQKIVDAELDNVHLRRVLHVDNAWWQCRWHLALQGSERAVISDRADYEKTLISVCQGVYPRGNGVEFKRFMKVVSYPMSCTDNFYDTVNNVIRNMFLVTSNATVNASSSQEHIIDLYFDIPTGQAKFADTVITKAFAHVRTGFGGRLFSAALAPELPDDFVVQLENSDIQLEKLRESATLAVLAESYNFWHVAYFQYRNFLEALVNRCDMPQPGSYLRHSYQMLFIWAALPYALTYHTQLKDYEHSIWLLRIVQKVMETVVPGPWLGGFVCAFTGAAYLAVELQVRMATWEWSCALRDQDGMLEDAEVLEEVATGDFPEQCQALLPEIGTARMGYRERAKASLCEHLYHLYNDLEDREEAEAWKDKINHYVHPFLQDLPASTHLPRVVGRVLRISPDTPAYPRITHVPTCIKNANPPPRSSGSSTPERMFNADPNNNLIF